MLAVGRFLLLPVALKAAVVRAVPTLSFPINSQVPPAARIGKFFSFAFSPSTFTSSSDADLSYSLPDPPPWLSLDSDGRSLYGTPQDDDIGPGTVVGVNITLVATDATGSASDDATLVVSRNPAPAVQIPVSEQIQGFGKYSEPSSILCYPDEDFNFAFASDTFSSSADADAPGLNYYAVMADSSPLPAWLTFDAGALAFAGTTPPAGSLIEPPQTFSLQLTASDVAGFSATSVRISIVVGVHALTARDPHVVLNATAGEPLAYDGLAAAVQLDGEPAGPHGNVTAAAEGLPSWLAFDRDSWNISGTPPPLGDARGGANFTVVVEDAYDDVLNITVSVLVTNGSSSGLFRGAFPPLSVRPGEQVEFDLADYLADPLGTDVTTDVHPATSWLSWDASALTLSGRVPSESPESIIDVAFTAQPRGTSRLKRAGAAQSQDLVIQIEPASPASSATSTSPTAAVTSTAAGSTGSSSSPSAGPKWTIVTAVVSAVAAAALIACLCLWCCTRRNKRRHSQSTTVSSPTISAPLPDTLIYTPGVDPNNNNNHKNNSPKLRRGSLFSPKTDDKTKRESTTTNLTPPPPPRLHPQPSLASIYTDAPEERLDSATGTGTWSSTPPGSGSGRLKGWYDTLRSFRVARLRRAGRARVVSATYLSDAEVQHVGGGSSQQRRRPREAANSFRSDLEVEVPTLSPGGTLGDATSLRRALGRRSTSSYTARQVKGRSMALLPTPESSDETVGGGGDPFFMETRPGRAAADDDQAQPVPQLDERDPFNSHPISPIPPISPLGGSLFLLPDGPDEAEEEAGPAAQRRPTRRPRAATTTTTTTSTDPNQPRRDDQPLRPAYSQRSFASSGGGSMDSVRDRTRKMAAKASAQAKGAMSLAGIAVRSPTRRTLARMRPSAAATLTVQRRSRGVLESANDDDDVSGNNSRAASRTGGGAAEGMMGDLLSAHAWPSPPAPEAAGREGRGPVVGFPQRVQNPPVRRRPVGGGGESSTAAAAAAAAEGDDHGGAGDGDDHYIVPLPTPLRLPSSRSSSSLPRPGASSSGGLGISMYDDIASSSPWQRPSSSSKRLSWATASRTGSRHSAGRGGGWGSLSGPNWITLEGGPGSEGGSSSVMAGPAGDWRRTVSDGDHQKGGESGRSEKSKGSSDGRAAFL